MRRSQKCVLISRPWSAFAFGVALLSMIVASIIEEALDAIGVEMHFAVFFLAVIVTSVWAGAPAGAFAAALTIPVIWWEFLPPRFEFAPLATGDYDRFVSFLLPSSLAIWACQLCREALALRD